MGVKILVVDDEKRIRKLIGDYLRNDGFSVVEAENGHEAVSKFLSCKDIDLVIMDVMMPIMSGWEACLEIRKQSDTPVIFLTALGEQHDETYGLNIGADDYIVKPFGYEVFMARVRSILRRINKKAEGFTRIGDLEIDCTTRVARVRENELELSPKEFDLLQYLASNQNIVLERDKILDAVWGFDFYGDRRTVDTHIKNIRAKLGDFGESIKTIRGFGYKFEVKP